jgi:hypothetical protein
MAWIMDFKLLTTIPDNTEVGIITATWDNPKFVFTMQGTIKDKNNILDQAEIELQKYTDALNTKANIETLVRTELQAAADARPVLDISISPNVKLTPNTFVWETPWKTPK